MASFAGAKIGSFFGPGIGTAAGALLGLLIGVGLNLEVYGKTTKEHLKDTLEFLLIPDNDCALNIGGLCLVDKVHSKNPEILNIEISQNTEINVY